MTVRYDPHNEWAREDQRQAVRRAREAVDRLTPQHRKDYSRPGASCLDRTDGYLCAPHYEEEARVADFGATTAALDAEVDLPW